MLCFGKGIEKHTFLVEIQIDIILMERNLAVSNLTTYLNEYPW